MRIEAPDYFTAAPFADVPKPLALLIVVILVVVPAYLVGRLAERRGYEFRFFATAAMLVSFLPPLIVLLILPRRT
ncbi:MAG: hypothetical protein ACR2G3_12590 [Solirubrobacterales bacterium]